ncbi:unnamed protein product [Periconia digitata]|uniref:Uncharacterized protein n=1 Tax=Periconia digitata TaxID=1303443 RepID=A0A9W4U999_9PLEO|nr:unnamed protein product [Periconia digitata]
MHAPTTYTPRFCSTPGLQAGEWQRSEFAFALAGQGSAALGAPPARGPLAGASDCARGHWLRSLAPCCPMLLCRNSGWSTPDQPLISTLSPPWISGWPHGMTGWRDGKRNVAAAASYPDEPPDI